MRISQNVELKRISQHGRGLVLIAGAPKNKTIMMRNLHAGLCLPLLSRVANGNEMESILLLKIISGQRKGSMPSCGNFPK